MHLTGRLTLPFLTLTLAALMLTSGMAADPGGPFPSTGSLGAGSVLIYNFYTSSVTNPVAENTLITITNTGDRESVFVHLFFVDGDTCSVADSYICLTRSQTMRFLASDVDPGITGYIIAIAVDENGMPVTDRSPSFFRAAPAGARSEEVAQDEPPPPPPPPPMLIGNELVKLGTGSSTSLSAEARPTPTLQPCEICEPLAERGSTTRGSAPAQADDIPSEVTILLDGLPRVLAMDSIQSQADGNSTLLVVNRIGGDLRTSAARLGPLFGILFDQLENPYSFTFEGGCQFRSFLNNSTFPRTTPRLNAVIPAGTSGWMKFWATGSDEDPEPAIVGAMLTFNPNSSRRASAFNGGHPLHSLTTAGTVSLTIPVFPPNCQ
ncbi:MAG TPA: hypothetical protein VFD58_01125 [Blastocatellia bacterium]|nr:hypothetical protein [Blastocatellia bacterium]